MTNKYKIKQFPKLTNHSCYIAQYSTNSNEGKQPDFEVVTETNIWGVSEKGI